MIRPTLATLAFLFAATEVASAQNVQFRGKVENSEAACYYCPGFDFVLDYTHVRLFCPTPLSPYMSQQVIGTGVWNGSVTAPAITVTSIQITEESFSFGGGGALGESLKFTAKGTEGQLSLIFGAFLDGFIPVPGYGVIFLDPNTFFVLGDGVIDDSGEFEIEVEIPNQANLIGLKVFGQAAMIDPVTGAGFLSNSDMKTIG